MQASARLSSSAASRKVIAGVSSATTRSCYRTSRGKAHAVPLSAQEPPPKGQKRISVQERRARIVEFVENYRASNDGKFPTKRSIRQQVGGSHYTVRDVLDEIKHNHAKFPLRNVKPAPLQGTVEVTEHPKLKDEARVVENQGILEVSEPSLPKDDAEVAQLQGTTQVLSDLTETEIMKDLMDKPDPGNQQRETEANKFNLKNSEKSLNANDSNASDQSGSDMANEAKTHATEHPKLKDEARVVENQGILEVSEPSLPKDDAEVAQLQGTTQVLSDLTETEIMKDLMDKPDPGNQQRETEDNKFNLKNSEKSLNANDSNASDQSGSDMANEAKTHAREDSPKLEESVNTGLLGSLKSFAYGIRNFWKNM